MPHDPGVPAGHCIHVRALVDDVAMDCRYATRSLLRQPVLAAAAVLCLAIGIAANATMFQVVDTLLLRPPAGVPNAGSLLWITAERHLPEQGFTEYPGVSYRDYLDLAGLPDLSGVAAYAPFERSFGQGVDVQQLNTLTITSTFMPLLNAKPVIGRFFDSREDSAGAPSVVVLGHAFWKRQFGGSTAVLGTSVRIGTMPYVVIGVSPPNFNGLERKQVDVYLPPGAGPPSRPGRRADPAALLANPHFPWLRVVARARPSVGRTSIEMQLKHVYNSIDRRDPFLGATLKLVVATPMSMVAMQSPQQAQDASISIWLNAVAVIVLLIACSNVASLLLARAFHRQHEIAIRLALGISKGRLMRSLLLEGVVLVTLGGAFALILGWFAMRVLRSTMLSGVDLGPAFLNTRVLAVTVAAMALTGLLTGLAPALAGTTVDPGRALRTSARSIIGRRQRTQTALLVAQIALALVLAVGATLFTQSFRNLTKLDLGFDADQVLRVRANPTAIGYTPERATQLAQRFADRIRELPGIERVALASGGPLGGSSGRRLWISGRLIEGFGVAPELATVSPEFFGTLGMELRRGRLFTSDDRADAPLVTVINEEMARRYWPAGDALGACIRVGRDSMPCTTVIGVVETARQGNLVFQPIQNEQPMSRYYLPMEQDSTGAVAPMLYVRSAFEAKNTVPLVRRAINEIEPAMPYPDVTAFSTALEPQFRPWRLGALMFTIFGGIALVLAVIGLYGVLAFRVSQRTQEIGIRMALGAERSAVRNLVIGQGLRLAGLGLGIGVILSLAIGRTVTSLLYGVSGTNPFVLAAVSVGLLAIAAAASYVPAIRATRVDPLVVLREL